MAMSGATLLVSTVALGVVKRVTHKRRVRELALNCKARIAHARPPCDHLAPSLSAQMLTATACTQCQGEGYVRCDICMGRSIVRCRPPRTMRQLMLEYRGVSEGGEDAAAAPMECECPACGTSMYQRCLNCLGEGKVCSP